MKTELKAKLLQHLIAKKEDKGFTLIELLVVIIIIGILSAIALPSFLNQANRARQSEASTYIGTINRGQQTYYLDNDTFSDDVESLDLGVPTATQFYTYEVAAGASDVEAINTATMLSDRLKGVAGRVFATIDGATGNATTKAVLCVNPVPGDVPDVAGVEEQADCP